MSGLSRASAAAAVVLALAAGHLLTSRLQVGGSSVDPFVRSAARADVAHLSYADVRIRDVRTAHYLASNQSTSTAVSAGGVFVLVVVALTPTHEPVTFIAPYLEDEQGRKFRTSLKSTCSPLVDTWTGVTTYALLCFDVPKPLLPELRLELGRGDVDNDLLRRDDLADLDLGIDDSEAAELAATDAAYRVEFPSFDAFELETVELNVSDPS